MPMIALLPLFLVLAPDRSSAVRSHTDRLQPEVQREIQLEVQREMCRNSAWQASRDFKSMNMKEPNKEQALFDQVEEILANGIAGDVVEAGVAFGGGVLPLIYFLACTGDLANRRVHLFDTWEGLPPSTNPGDEGFGVKEYHATYDSFLYWAGLFSKRYDDFVSSNPSLGQAALPDWQQAWSHVNVVKGLFADTMPGSLSGRQLALLMCDGDMYSSTVDCLSSAGQLVVKGGAIYNDDYFMFKGCYAAVQEFKKSAAGKAMKSFLFNQFDEYHLFPEPASGCNPPKSNKLGAMSGDCWGALVEGGILRVE